MFRIRNFGFMKSDSRFW